MKWNKIQPGDMILIADQKVLKPFEHDVYFVIGIQNRVQAVDIQLFNPAAELYKTRTHKITQEEISPVFQVYRNGARCDW